MEKVNWNLKKKKSPKEDRKRRKREQRTDMMSKIH